MIRFTFDDNNTSDLWAANMLKRYGLQGIFFLNDKPGFGADVEALLELGMIVGNHTAKHTNLSGLNDEEILKTIGYFNDKLKSYGATGEYFSFPFSAGPIGHPIITSMFKYVYRGVQDPKGNENGEIYKVSVVGKSDEEVLGFDMPLQLHGIETGQSFDISRELFIKLCEKHAK